MRLNQYFGTGVGAGAIAVGKGLEDFEAAQIPESADGIPETPEEALASLQDADEAQAHYVGEVDKLQEAEVALEQYLDVIRKANRTGYGLSPDAISMLSIGLEHWERKFPMPELGLEDFPIVAGAKGTDNAEKGLGARLKKVWEMIKKAYALLKEAAVAFYNKLTSNLGRLDKQCEHLLGKLKGMKNNPEVGQFEVKGATLLFNQKKFVGQDAATMDTLTQWAFSKYPTDLERYIKEVTTLIRGLKPESTYLTFAASLKALKMPLGGLHPNLVERDQEGVFQYDNMPGNQAVVIHWPKVRDGSYYDVATAIREFDIRIAQLAGAPTPPDSVTVTPTSVEVLRRRVETIGNAIKAAIGREADVKGVSTAVVGLNTATEECYKRNGSPVMGEDMSKHPALLATYLVGSVQKMSTAGLNSILAYVTKVYHAQLALIEREVAAHGTAAE